MENCLKKKKVRAAFIDLEKGYEIFDRESLWKVLGMNGVDGNLVRAVSSMYEDANAAVYHVSGTCIV